MNAPALPRPRRAVLVAALLVLGGLSACMAPEPPPFAGRVLPAYVFPLGASQEDVMGMLGPPPLGPRFDSVTMLTEVIYRFPFPAIQAESRLGDGVRRVERTDKVHLFFNRGGRLERIDLRPNLYYPSQPGTLAHQITILPRVIGLDGKMRLLGPPA